MRNRYLFIRILEACNADCFMCDFALSRDRFRFRVEDFEILLPAARAIGVQYVRFTGGEPLLHKDILVLIRKGADFGMRMSLITNGTVLAKRIDQIAAAGLNQVIVSIDGGRPETHDHYRNTQGLFDRCISGLEASRARGISTRVNTVVGPHNYTEIPRMQKLLTEIGVQQWELSALKLERPIMYTSPDHVVEVCEPVYQADPQTNLIPMGVRFYGESEAERERFFHSGVTPRAAAPRCNLVGDVIYLDAKSGRGFGCSLLPHREFEESGGGVPLKADQGWMLDNPEFQDHVQYFREAGPRSCTSCSTTAAGYSNDVAQARLIGDWHF